MTCTQPLSLSLMVDGKDRKHKSFLCRSSQPGYYSQQNSHHSMLQRFTLSFLKIRKENQCSEILRSQKAETDIKSVFQ